MSEIELPAPAGRLTECPDGWVNHGAAGYSAEQVRAAILAERERCARVADEKAAGIARVNTYRGKVNQVSQHAVDMVESVAAAIRRGSV